MTCNVENKSVSGDEVTTLSLFAAAEGGGRGEGGGGGGGGGKGEKEARGSAKLSEDIKNKIRRRASGRIKGDDCAALRITKDRGRGRKGDSREACIMDRYCCVSMRPLRQLA